MPKVLLVGVPMLEMNMGVLYNVLLPTPSPTNHCKTWRMELSPVIKQLVLQILFFYTLTEIVAVIKAHQSFKLCSMNGQIFSSGLTSGISCGELHLVVLQSSTPCTACLCQIFLNAFSSGTKKITKDYWMLKKVN